MKKILYIFVFVAVAATALISCEDSDTVGNATLTIQSASVIVPYTGGSTSVGYRVGNARYNAYFVASTEVDWISDFDLTLADTLTFYVAPHYERESRYGDIELMYMLDADTLASSTIHVSQEYYSYYNFETSYASGRYYGTANYFNNEGIRQYSIYLSDTQIDEYGSFVDGATYYFLDFWTNADVEGVSEVLLPTGGYSFGQVGENWTLSESSQYFVMNEDGEDEWGERYSEQLDVAEGYLTVTRSGDMTTIAGTLEDSLGGVHDIMYSGALSLENEGIISTLEGNEALGTLSDVACEAQYYGDYYQTGTANWLLCIYPEVGTGFMIDICADASFDMNGGIPVGTFSASSSGGVMDTFLAGNIFNGYLTGTWLLSLDENGALTPPYAPICSGTVEISASGENYTVTIDGVDDLEYSVTGTWTGVPSLVDYRTSTTSLTRLRIPLWN